MEFTLYFLLFAKEKVKGKKVKCIESEMSIVKSGYSVINNILFNILLISLYNKVRENKNYYYN